jgi:glycosyltransferase involved in cell wall biosynthesis
MGEEGKQQISAVVNTYNAEQFLDEVLQSLGGFDEIVVCDMESTDRTCEIARNHGCRIVTFPKEGHTIVEPARDFAIHQARCEWVFVVDADELAPPQLHDYLYRRIASPDCPAGLFVPRRNKFMAQYDEGPVGDYQLRFFKREGTTWPAIIHATPVIHGPVEKIPNNLEGVVLMHLPAETLHDRIEKLNRYTDNEVEKKAGKNYGAGALLYRPMWRFLRSYLLQGGFRLGVRGFIRAVLDGAYQFFTVAKLIEHRMKKN